jgi:CRP-like cAMP-binding protein
MWTPIEPDLLAVTAKGNDLLAALPEEERLALGAGLERRTLPIGDELYRPKHPIEHVFFPVDSVVSLLTVLDDGRRIETATVGREGMVGLFVFLEDNQSSNGQALVQMEGDVLRLPVDVFLRASTTESRLGSLMIEYTRAMIVHMSQSAACNAVHTVPQRLARWLLQTSDRTGSVEIHLTQEFLSEVLGVRRASVTGAVRQLATDGAIRAARGTIVIDDRSALEELACECYRMVKASYARLMPR